MDKSDFTEPFPGRLTPIGDGLVAFVPNALPPSITMNSRTSNLCDEATSALGGLKQVIPFLPNPGLLTGPFLRREAVLSSKIEGTHTNLEQLYLFEIEGSDQENSADRFDAREVHNYVKALQHGLSRTSEIPVCARLLKELHELLLRGLLPERGSSKYPGEFRTNQAYIGSRDIVSARYVAPPPPEIDRLFQDLERFINATDSPLPALIWIAVIHYQFEAIHPFADGNGRIGRLLISLLLAKRVLLPEPLLYLSAYFERHREKYNLCLWEVSRCGAWGAWIEFFLEGVKLEATDAVNRARKLLDAREAFRARFREKRGKALELVDLVFREPVLTIRQAQEKLNLRTYRGTQKIVDALTDAGLLDLILLAPKVYRNKPVFEVLSTNG